MITESAFDRNEVSFMNIRHKRKEKEESVSTARELFQWVAAIVAAVLIALAIDNFVIVNAQIPSGSMENTIMTGDRVIGNRFAYSFSDPQRFDIIIFRYPDDERQLFIKRIIGLPGETVEIRDGKIYLNGSDEPLEDVQTKETMVGSFGPYTVPENSYFVMGDNRNDSKIPATGPILLLQKMRFSERRSSATGRFLNLKFLNKIFSKKVCENENHISHTSSFILIIPFSDITRSIRSSCSSVGISSHIRLSLHRIAFSQSSGIFSR